MRVSEVIQPQGGRLEPTQEDKTEPRLLRAFAPLHKTALGLACGTVVGGLLAIATAIVVAHGNRTPNLDLLEQFLWEYSLSWPGVLVGLLWGFAVGFVMGYGFALVRNAAIWVWLTVIRSRAEMDQYSDFLDHM